jgi:hypothetical protein
MAYRLQAICSELTPSPKTRVLHLALVGDVIEPLKLLLEDVLTDSGVRYELTSQPGAYNVVIVMVNWGEELRVIAAARALAGDVPLLAILPFGDDWLVQRVLLAGAQGWYALDAPLDLLRASLVKLADLGSPADDEAA